MELDSRLAKISDIVVSTTCEKIMDSMAIKKLIHFNKEENYWQLCGPLTPLGFNIISHGVITSVRYFFEQSKITIPPSIPFNPEAFAFSMSENIDIPKIRTQNNEIEIEFVHPKKAPIKRINSYLNPELENPIPLTTRNIEITHNGILITSTQLNQN
ncbi:MAG TPA: hypothetical protein VN174_02395 [Candidatus Methanoperedens sp.]|nr:hypothetical protein [Candidatus Methanoperedens sp.]